MGDDARSPGDYQQVPQLCMYTFMRLRCRIIVVSSYIMKTILIRRSERRVRKNDSRTQLVRGRHSGWPQRPLP